MRLKCQIGMYVGAIVFNKHDSIYAPVIEEAGGVYYVYSIVRPFVSCLQSCQ